MVIHQRSYLSRDHLYGAHRFQQAAKEIEQRHQHKQVFNSLHRAYVISSVLASVAFMEATVNELFADAADNHLAHIQTLGAEPIRLMAALYEDLDQAKALPKYQAILSFSAKEPIAKGSRFFQDASLVIKLRNALVHYKPATYGGAKQHTFLAQLGNKFSVNPLTSPGNAFFPDKCLGSECALWAVMSARAFVDEFCRRLNLTLAYQKLAVET